MLKTLAAKHRSTVTKMARKYKATIDTPHGPRTCFEATRRTRQGRKPLVARFGGIPLKRQKKAVLDRPPASPGLTRRKELVTRLLARPVRALRARGPRWKSTRSASSPTSPDRDGRSPRGRSSWPGCGARPSWSAPPATTAIHDGQPTATLTAVVTGEPRARKGARVVRTGGRRKRTRTRGTSPAAYRCARALLVRGLNALAAVISTPLAAPVIAATRLRGGNANSARGAASLAAEAITTARQAGCTGLLVFRIDSAYYSAAVLQAIRRGGARFSVTVPVDRQDPRRDRRHQRGRLDPDHLPPRHLG